jgi:hypothetical protein
MIFAIDDSAIEIEGRPHTVLGAIGVGDPSTVESALNRLKAEFGLAPADEVKWNGMPPMPLQDREALSQELMVLLRKSVPLVVINEGRDKQLAAERTAGQIAEFMEEHSYLKGPQERVDLIFDQGILGDQRRYLHYLQTLSPSPVGSARITSVVSHQSSVVQLADVLAGFSRLSTEIALGRANKQLIIPDGGPGYDVKTTLLNYILSSLRWAMWGRVPPPPDPNNVPFDASWPFKRDGGYGFRIHSTISTLTIDQVYDSRIVYMGCMR